MYALKITTSGQMSKITIEKPTFRGLAKAIDARNFEVVHASGMEPPLVMIVDEDGRFTGKPTNPYGSLLNGILSRGTTIVGDILIMKEGVNNDGELDIVGLSEIELDVITFQLNILMSKFAIISDMVNTRKGAQSNG